MKRGRSTLGTTYTNSSPTAMNTQLRSKSPTLNKNLDTINPTSIGSYYIRLFKMLTLKYSKGTNFNLKPT